MCRCLPKPPWAAAKITCQALTWRKNRGHGYRVCVLRASHSSHEKAQEVAETEVRNIAAALVLREVQDKLQNLPRDTISDPVVDNIARAAGDAGREGEDGK